MNLNLGYEAEEEIRQGLDLETSIMQEKSKRILVPTYKYILLYSPVGLDLTFTSNHHQFPLVLRRGRISPSLPLMMPTPSPHL